MPKFIAPRASAGGVFGRLLGMGLFVIGMVFLSRFGRAHTPGLSVAHFEVLTGGGVEAHLAFASAEPLGRLDLDRDRDGRVTSADLAAARDDLRAFVLDGIEVVADGSRCPGSFGDAALAEPDGLLIEARYACPAGATEVAVTLFYLSDLPAGHREVARIVAGSSTAEAVLTGHRRGLALKLQSSAVASRGRTEGLLAVLAVAAFALLLWWKKRFKAS